MKKQWLFIIATLFLAAIFMFGTFGLANSAGVATTPTPNPYPTSASPRQGVSPYYFNQNNLSKLGGWVALWSPYAGAYTTAFQIIPMVSWSQDLPSISTVQYIDGQTPNYNYWLVFNECEQIGQCDKPPAVQAQFYHDQVRH
jgi:hypothetical protein